MAGQVLELRGCTPEPLGNYLKGLGVFRLIAEQADPQARAWWKDGVLHVLQQKWSRTESTSAEDHCIDWLLSDCRFTPLIAPWQTGTGYLPIGKRDAGGDALIELLKSEHHGTEAFRSVFKDFSASLNISLPDDPSQWLEAMKAAGSEHSDADLLRRIRNRLRFMPSLKWLDSVGLSASRSHDSDVPSWFPILARGGGEKSGQYIVNHQQRLQTVLLGDSELSINQLKAAVFSENQCRVLENKALSAMYFPAYVKNWNSTQDFLPDGERCVNPWDFILLLEGCLVWAMATTRRIGATSEKASFPFYSRSSFGGSLTTTPKEVEGSEKSIAKGELWCPVWNAPSTLTEVDRIFGEGRIQVGAKVCTRSLDFALAMTGFGTDRGIQAFHRYSILGRSGSITTQDRTVLLAVPNGCFVPHRATGISLLADLRDFAESIATNLTENGQQPRRLMQARIEFERGWFDTTSATVTGSHGIAQSLVDLLVATGRLVRELGTNSTKPGVVKIKKGEKTSERVIAPVGDLQRQWAERTAKTDQTSEYRLARAIASITAWGEREVQGRKRPAVESIRGNLISLVRPWAKWEWYDPKAHKGFHDASVWSRGVPVEVNLAAVLRRRLIDAQRCASEGLPLWSSYGASFNDLLAFWNREVDEDRVSDLINGLASVETWSWKPGSKRQIEIDAWQKNKPERSETPNIDTSKMWFDEYDLPRGKLHLPAWVKPEEFDDACELPRVYHLLKLCFVGGRMPHRPVEGQTTPRTGDEPFPPTCLDVLTLLQAGRMGEAVQLAARRLRAKGYPTVLRDDDLTNLTMPADQCRGLVGMLLIPVRQPGVCAALAIKPEPTH
ncbi:MAG TPA: type I-U CRISPR-associated protein Csx17 [Pirellulaceae bacterium]|nr:type I-U CRISPR-associated protein Csx17 [Pirellulaceae bacterium]